MVVSNVRAHRVTVLQQKLPIIGENNILASGLLVGVVNH
jgi:hypothetical protein